MLSGARRQANPAHHEHPEHMAMREQRDICVGRAGPGYHPVHPRAHLLRRFAARASIPEDQPTRRALVDLLGRQSFLLPVVPLGQVWVDNGAAA